MALNLWGQGTDALAVRVAVRVGAGSVLPSRVRRVRMLRPSRALSAR
jgi:hypothetical protein